MNINKTNNLNSTHWIQQQQKSPRRWKFSSGLGQTQAYGGVKPLMGSQLTHLDNWISNSNTYIIKRLKNPHRVAYIQQMYVLLMVQQIWNLIGFFLI